jgi:hypothetical protein
MKTTTFYIYEVPGHKNGCTIEWQNRSQQNFEKYNILPVLVETYNYPDEPEYWQIVGDREWELAEKNGYLKGTHYRIAREQRILASKSGAKSQLKTGKHNFQNGYGNKTFNNTIEHQSNAAKIANANPNHVNKKKDICPHCNKIGHYIAMRRWHFNNCKQKQ